ncbi:alanine:cation symporter family protein, partial [Gordonia sp. NPDC003429]
FDTFLICSITAFIILVSVPDLGTASKGIGLTQGGLESALGSWTHVALSIIVFLLAFSSILGNYYYGESNIEFLGAHRAMLTVYRVLAVLAVFAGSVASSDLVWNLADGIMGVMALINLIAIALLSGIAFKLLADFTRQRRAGRDPIFTRDRLPEVGGVECWEDEDTVTGPMNAVSPAG